MQMTWLQVIPKPRKSPDPLINHKSRIHAEQHQHYKHIQETGTEASQVERYLKVLARIQPATDNEVKEIMGIPAARVSARRNKLVAQRKVELAGHKVCSITGYNVRAWQLTNKEK